MRYKLAFDRFLALGDYNSALKIDPKNESINEDAEKIRQIIQSS